MKVNPTEAKDIALEFIALTNQRLTPQLISRTVKQVKSLMEFGFTAEEIHYTVDVVLSAKPDVYSFGYIDACINDVLRARKTKEMQEKGKEIKKQQELKPKSITGESEVAQGDETTERNRRKAERFGIQSREREKSYFDLFEGQ